MNQEALKILALLIQEFEGLELNAYLCPAKVWTIGYGHTEDVKQGDFITLQMANDILKKDMEKYWDGALRLSYKLDKATPSQQAAIVDFCYNCGLGNYEKSSLRRLVGMQDWEGASKSILKWNKAKVNGVLTVLRGLTRRRIAESKLLLK